MTRYEGDYIVWGPPGTGKTHFLTKQVEAIGMTDPPPGYEPPVLICSLTHTAASEIAARNPILRRSRRVGTLHSHAFRALGNPKMVMPLIPEWNEQHPGLRLSEKESSRIEDAGDDWSGDTAADVLLSRCQLARARLVAPHIWAREVQEFSAKWEAFKEERGVMDFTDLIDHANLDETDPPVRCDIVIADEAQDLSALEFKLITRWSKWAGAGIFAGDPWQALYTWRGAHPELFENEDIPPEKRRVLKKSWRIPRSIQDFSMRWVRRLSTYKPLSYEPRDGDDGSIEENTSASWKFPEPAIDDTVRCAERGETSMILGSCAYLMTPTVNTLRANAVPFSNPWRIRNGAWNPLARRKGTNSAADRYLALMKIDKGMFGDQAGQWSAWDVVLWAFALGAGGIMKRGGKKRINDLRKSAGSRESAEQIRQELRGAPGDVFVDEVFLPAVSEMLMDLSLQCEIGKDSAERLGLGEDPARTLSRWYEDHLSTTMRRVSEYPIQVAKRRGVLAVTDTPKIYVGTIHSFKGAEADNVFIFPDLSAAASVAWSGESSTEAKDSVVRMFYVGITRAKKRLVICGHASPQHVPLDEAPRA